MVNPVQIGGISVGRDNPCFIVAEIGINHNGDIEKAMDLIDVAVEAECQMVKFQKRTPDLHVKYAQYSEYRDTPWGRMPYLAYRKAIEFDVEEYSIIAAHCRARGILWTASAWDEPSVEFLESFAVPCHKVASACLTDESLLRAIRKTQKPVILSTGMSTPEEIEKAFRILYDGLPPNPVVLLHCTSAYPCSLEELNLRCLLTLGSEYHFVPIGYSGHEVGLPTTLAAVTLGAKLVERHITLDRASWGTDQAASLEPLGLKRLVGGIRAIESALGDGIKRVYPSEEPVKAKLRRFV